MVSQKRAEELRRIDRASVWHPFTQMALFKEDNILIERGEGNFLIDVDGKRYFDGYSSLWVNLHGHCNKAINDAVKEQLDTIAHSTLLGSSNIPSIELAEKLLNITPKRLSKVFYSDSGSTAVEIALKMAYQYRQQGGEKKRKKYFSLTNAYHGDTIGSVSVGGIPLFHQTFHDLLFECVQITAPHCYRCPWGKEKENCSRECEKEMEQTIEQHADEATALIMEPLMQGAAGMIKHPSGYLKKVEQMCRQKKVLLILDEVATGFGRTGTLFACEQEDVEPDLMCVAKGISGGYLPLAATFASEEIYEGFLGKYEEFRSFFHGHSYTGNQLACRAGIASLELLTAEGEDRKRNEKAKLLSSLLEELKENPHVGNIRQCGLMCGIELVMNKNTKEAYPTEARKGHQVLLQAREFGLLTRPLGDVLILIPPLSSTREELISAVEAIQKSIGLVCGRRSED